MSTPEHRLEELAGIEDDLGAAITAIKISETARTTDKQAMEIRDRRIRAANAKGISMSVIAKTTGLSYPMVRVICRRQDGAR